MMKSNTLVQLLYAVEAAGYATAGSDESSAEWHAAAIARWRRRHGLRAVLPLGSTLVSVLLAILLAVVRAA